jgi:hypothetical protein
MNLTLTIPESEQPPITVEVGGTTELTSYVAQVAGLPDYPATFPPAIGSAANQAVAGNDPRLTNSRTPTAHKSSHATGGSDALTPADIGAVQSNITGIAGADAITNVVSLTQAEHDAIGTPDASTLYVITS